MTDEKTFKYANKISSNLLMFLSVAAFIISYAFDRLFNFSGLKYLIFFALALTILITEIKIKKRKRRENLK